MNELKKLKAAIKSEPHRGRHAEIKKAFSEYEDRIHWYYPMVKVISLQAVLMLVVVGVWG